MTTTAPPEDAAAGRAAVPPPSAEVIASMTLAERLARITAEVGPVAKSGRNQHFGYSYQRAEDVGAAVAPLLGRYGVSITPRIAFDEIQVVDTGRTTKGGAPIRDYTVPVSFLLSCPTGADLVPWVALATDDSDKGVNKAITAAVKSFLRAQFLIPTGDDDTDSTEGSRTAAEGGASGGGSASGAWAGELPNVSPGDEVNGHLAVAPDGGIGIVAKAPDRDVFQEILRTIKAIPGRRYDSEEKVWVVPAGQGLAAVAIARHLGLTIPDDLAERFPAEPADDLASAATGAATPQGGDDDESIPF